MQFPSCNSVRLFNINELTNVLVFNNNYFQFDMYAFTLISVLVSYSGRHKSIDKRHQILYCIVHNIILNFKSNERVNKSLYTVMSTKKTKLKVSPWLESVHMDIIAVPFNKSTDFQVHPPNKQEWLHNAEQMWGICFMHIVKGLFWGTWSSRHGKGCSEFLQWTGCPSGLSPVHVTHWADLFTGPGPPSSRSSAFPPRFLQLVFACRQTQKLKFAANPQDNKSKNCIQLYLFAFYYLGFPLVVQNCLEWYLLILLKVPEKKWCSSE